MTTDQQNSKLESNKAKLEEVKNKLRQLLNSYQHANYRDEKSVREIVRILQSNPVILEELPDSTEYTAEQKKGLIIALASSSAPLPEDLQDTLSNKLNEFPDEENYENSKQALRGRLTAAGWASIQKFIERLQGVKTLEGFRQTLAELNDFLEDSRLNELSSREFDGLFDQLDRLFEDLSERQQRATGGIEPASAVATRLEINREMERLYGFLLGRQIISV